MTTITDAPVERVFNFLNASEEVYSDTLPSWLTCANLSLLREAEGSFSRNSRLGRAAQRFYLLQLSPGHEDRNRER